MKRYFSGLSISLLLVAVCSSFAWGNGLFQYSVINALLAGAYDGELTVRELKQKGDFGLGTFNALDGEMILLEGKVYKVRADGQVEIMADDAKSPFAVAVPFETDRLTTVESIDSLEQLEQKLDAVLPSANLPYAIRIDGRFQKVKARSVPKQKRPYPSLASVVEHQSIFQFTNVEGTLVAFRCPAYVSGVNVPGYHFHFLSADGKSGGHVLDISFNRGEVKIDQLDSLDIHLPDNADFQEIDFSKDRKKELHKVEKD